MARGGGRQPYLNPGRNTIVKTATGMTYRSVIA